MSQILDTLIIGSGPGGLTAAVALAQAGQNVLVCEQHDLGEDLPPEDGSPHRAAAILRAREQHRRMQPSPMMPRPQVPMQQVFDHMRDQQRLRERAERAAGTRGIRRSVFAGAFMLVAAGFLLQILGSWPGCCSQVGIVPSGG